MFTSHHILNIILYLCAQNAQCLARIEISIWRYNYNRLKKVLVEKELARGYQSRWITVSVQFHVG